MLLIMMLADDHHCCSDASSLQLSSLSSLRLQHCLMAAHIICSLQPAFQSVLSTGQQLSPFKDGGMADRVGLELWRKRRRQELPSGSIPQACVHLVSRSSPFSGSDDVRGSGAAASVPSGKHFVRELVMRAAVQRLCCCHTCLFVASAW